MDNGEQRRRELDHKTRAISALLDSWDPIGVYDEPHDAPPPGEYENLLPTVIRSLTRSDSPATLASELRATLNASYGIDGDPGWVSKKIVEVWAASDDPWRA